MDGEIWVGGCLASRRAGDGMQDLDFTAALIADISDYCIDPQKSLPPGTAGVAIWRRL